MIQRTLFELCDCCGKPGNLSEDWLGNMIHGTYCNLCLEQHKE